jgi:hypothetical protein
MTLDEYFSEREKTTRAATGVKPTPSPPHWWAGPIFPQEKTEETKALHRALRRVS